MHETPLHLVKVPLRSDRLVAEARKRGIPRRDLDDGYLAHCVLRELWQERAPAPFVLRPRGRWVDAWGYGRADASTLIAEARRFGDPSLLAVINDVEAIDTRVMPKFEVGRRLGFSVRACPVVRLSQAKGNHRAGAEVDAFLARCLAADHETAVSREIVYRDWLTRHLEQTPVTGVKVERVDLTGMSREFLVRRTQGHNRTARRLERPDVRFEGELSVVDGGTLLDYLAHGVGRHRAFGFGALFLAPPRSGRKA